MLVKTQNAPDISETFIANVSVFGQSEAASTKGVISQCVDKRLFFFNITLPTNQHFPKGGYFLEILNDTYHYTVLPEPNGDHKCVCDFVWFSPYFWWLKDAHKTRQPPPETPTLDCWGLGEHIEDDVCFLNQTIKREFKFLVRPHIHYIDYDLFTAGKCIDLVLPAECKGIHCERKLVYN